MNEPIRVLVTGIGGDLGQALVKALRIGKNSISCHGCDIDPKGIGSAFVESFHEVPAASDPAYVGTLSNLCDKLTVDAVILSTEPEIQVLCQMGSPPALPGGTPIVCQEADFIRTYGDKLACMQALWGKVDLAPFADGDDSAAVTGLVQEAGFPLVIKGRHSWGSHARHIVNNDSELHTALAATPLPMVQAFLDATNGEFSAGVFSHEGFTSSIVFKRELGSSGNSWFAETSQDESVAEYVTEIARVSALRGGANIQVRKTDAGVRLLEINPRFSSLVAARAACGFRDAEWSLEMALGRAISLPSGDYKHVRFRRYFHELMDFGDGYRALQDWFPNSVRVASHKTDAQHE